MILFFAIGFIYALLISTGMGGGILIAPYLIQYCDFEINEAKAVLLLLYIPASLILTYRNIKNSVIVLDIRNFSLMAFAGVVGVIIGKILFDSSDVKSMKIAYAFFVILVGLLQIGSLILKRKRKKGCSN